MLESTTAALRNAAQEIAELRAALVTAQATITNLQADAISAFPRRWFMDETYQKYSCEEVHNALRDVIESKFADDHSLAQESVAIACIDSDSLPMQMHGDGDIEWEAFVIPETIRCRLENGHLIYSATYQITNG